MPCLMLIRVKLIRRIEEPIFHIENCLSVKAVATEITPRTEFRKPECNHAQLILFC